jgi:hypothetical protein
MSNHLVSKEKIIRYILKIGVILSCVIGIALHFKTATSGFMNRIFLAFTIQSNMWIAAICLIFLVFDIFFRNIKKPLWLHVIKFMFTISILLTYIVFSVLLTPMMEIDYLVSLSNILLHTVTAIFALLDFILDDYQYLFKRKYLLVSGLIMPLLYSVYFFIHYEISNQMPVPYFFLDFKQFGWLAFKNGGIGVIYWMVILCAVLFVLGYYSLKLRDICIKKPLSTSIITFSVMLCISIIFSVLSIIL